MNHVMLDLETLGTTADAAVLSIGAVRFDPHADKLGERPDDKFYASISIDSNQVLGRRIQEDTMLWWLTQSREAQQVFHEPKQTLEAALLALTDWLAPIGDKIEVWAKPAKFDIAILEHAFAQVNLDCPWPHWASNCLASFKKRVYELDAVGVPSAPKPEIAHNALHDAIAQAKYVQLLIAHRRHLLNLAA
jgi:exodeoxyribonuclease VIII